MRIEIPEVKRCCCCLPLRRGLICWVYFKLVTGFLLLLHSIFYLISLAGAHRKVHIQLTITSITLIMSLLELAFCILFLVSAHRKVTDYMRIYYRYSICILIFEVLSLLGCSGFTIYICIYSIFVLMFLYQIIVEILCFIALEIVLQVYLVILVRSEIRKLENSVKFEFVYNTIEPECTVEIIA